MTRRGFFRGRGRGALIGLAVVAVVPSLPALAAEFRSLQGALAAARDSQRLVLLYTTTGC